MHKARDADLKSGNDHSKKSSVAMRNAKKCNGRKARREHKGRGAGPRDKEQKT